MTPLSFHYEISTSSMPRTLLPSIGALYTLINNVAQGIFSRLLLKTNINYVILHIFNSHQTIHFINVNW
jgi:hypothetical protein